MSFGERLATVLRIRGVKQNELAKVLYVTPACVCNYVKDRTHPDFTTLNRICDFLEISPDYLLGRTNHVYGQKHRACDVS